MLAILTVEGKKMEGGQTLAQDHKKMRKNVRKRGEIKGKEGVKLRYREQEKAM